MPPLVQLLKTFSFTLTKEYNMNVDYLADLFIMFMCFSIIGYYIGQYLNVYVQRYKDKRMHDQFIRKGFTVMKDDNGKEWYVGYGWPYDN
jgi:hypothetical protein